MATVSITSNEGRLPPASAVLEVMRADRRQSSYHLLENANSEKSVCFNTVSWKRCCAHLLIIDCRH